MLSNEELAELACREYWTVEEFSYLLAGRGCDVSQPHEELSNKARKEIDAAIHAGALPIIPGQDPAGAAYGLQMMRPIDAYHWATSKPDVWRFHKTFPKFKAAWFAQSPLFDHSNSGGHDTGGVNNSERSKLLRQIAVLALGLAEKSGRYKRGKNPNASQIAELAQEILEELPDTVTQGLGSSSIRESISEGLQLLTK